LRRVCGRVFSFLASNGLACSLFLLLLLVTLLGTLHQVDHGLYAAQRRYFASFFLIHRAFGRVPVPLPGGYLLIVLLFVNVVCGGILRIRKDWARAGIVVCHGGVCALLAGAFLARAFSTSGRLTLYEGEAANAFESANKWEVVVGRSEATSSVLTFPV